MVAVNLKPTINHVAVWQGALPSDVTVASLTINGRRPITGTVTNHGEGASWVSNSTIVTLRLSNGSATIRAATVARSASVRIVLVKTNTGLHRLS